MVQAPEQRIAALEARPNRDRSNSSKPPSAEPLHLKRRPPRPASRRRRGGRAGHERHARELVPAARSAGPVEIEPRTRTGRGHALDGQDPGPIRHRVAELPEVRPEVIEYRPHRPTCPGCGATDRAKLPGDVPRGAFGPRPRARAGLSSGAHRLGERRVRRLFADPPGVAISTGMVARLRRQVGEIPADPTAEVVQAVRQAESVHVDETGWRGAGERDRLGVGVAAEATAFGVHRWRGHDALEAPPGEDPGGDRVIISDRLPTHARAPKRQLRRAHLRRDLRARLALILCGEMGTGKTWMGAVAVHLHAKGKPYRACIMAPNHLIDKWAEEIEMTLPGVSARAFEKSGDGYDDSDREVLAYADSCRGEDSVKVTKDGRQDRARWSVPEWCIIGRNQAEWEPMGRTPWVRNPGIFHDRIYKLTDRGGNPKSVKMSHLGCPKCGQIARSGDTVIDPKKFSSQVTCKTLYLVEVADEKRPATGLDVVTPLPDGVSKNSEVGRLLAYKGQMYRLAECGEPLWTWTPNPRKWAPAKIVQTKMDRLFDDFILDEMHEEKSASSAQAPAACKIMTASKRMIGLTGTLIGGYAHHLFPLLMRMAPRTLIAEGFEWGGEMAFSKIHGRIDPT